MRILWCAGREYVLPVLLSDEDYVWAYEQGNWFVTHGDKGGRIGYAVRSVHKPGGGKGLVWLHKEVLRRSFRLPPCPLHRIGDHMNGNTLDNGRDNLRWATPQMNARNLFGYAMKQGELAL